MKVRKSIEDVNYLLQKVFSGIRNSAGTAERMEFCKRGLIRVIESVLRFPEDEINYTG